MDNRIMKTTIDGQKYIALCGLKIPYSTQRNGARCRLKIGPLSIPYHRSLTDDRLCLVLFGREYPLVRDRRGRHYAMRRKLTDETIEALLTEELEPLLGYRPNLKQPKTFNEKINYYKLHDHNPLITTCCDKYSLKQYASEKIGAQYVLPVLGAWMKADDIDFDSLPDRFVIKVNWSSGDNIIVRSKSQLEIPAVRKKLASWMRPGQNGYYDMFNWGYKEMKPVIYAEPYIEQIDGQLYDYKLFFCDGEFRFFFIATDRYCKEGLTHTFFDPSMQPLPFTYGRLPNAKPLPVPPKHLDQMIMLGKKLAEPFHFVRVDFYETSDEQVFLGEMTFYPGGGTLPFHPPKWDAILGSWMN